MIIYITYFQLVVTILSFNGKKERKKQEERMTILPVEFSSEFSLINMLISCSNNPNHTTGSWSDYNNETLINITPTNMHPFLRGDSGYGHMISFDFHICRMSKWRRQISRTTNYNKHLRSCLLLLNHLNFLISVFY